MRPHARGELTLGQTALLLGIGVILLYGGIALGAALRMVAQGVDWDEGARRVTSEPLGPSLAQLIALGVVLFLGVRMAHGDRGLRESLRIRPVRAQVVLFAMIAGVCLQFPMVELTTSVSDMVPAIAFDQEQLQELARITRIDGWARAITVPLALIVIAPVTEELVFRGLLLPALRTRLGATGALVTTAALFGIFHMHPLVAIYASVAGLALGALLLRTGSVLPSIAFHASFNAVPILLPEELIAIPGFNVAEGEHLPSSLVIVATAAGAIALLLLHRSAGPTDVPDVES